jgi:hypothetical protein
MLTACNHHWPGSHAGLSVQDTDPGGPLWHQRRPVRSGDWHHSLCSCAFPSLLCYPALTCSLLFFPIGSHQRVRRSTSVTGVTASFRNCSCTCSLLMLSSCSHPHTSLENFMHLHTVSDLQLCCKQFGCHPTKYCH